VCTGSGLNQVPGRDPVTAGWACLRKEWNRLMKRGCHCGVRGVLNAFDVPLVRTSKLRRCSRHTVYPVGLIVRPGSKATPGTGVCAVPPGHCLFQPGAVVGKTDPPIVEWPEFDNVLPGTLGSEATHRGKSEAKPGTKFVRD
jgi:hypothetical protein